MEDRRVEVFIIRHAESEENVKIRALCEAIVQLQSLKLPSWDHVSKIASLFECELDSKLSDYGKRQAKDMQMILKSRGFWQQEFDLVGYSPMIRAVETSATIVPETIFERSERLEILREISPVEQLIKSRVAKKIQDFESWLRSTPVGVKKIVLIGHCQYFNSLLGMKTLMRNCDVWQSTVSFPVVDSDQIQPNAELSRCAWTTPVLLHRSGLSEPHPIGKLFDSGWKGWGGWGPEEPNENDASTDDHVSDMHTLGRSPQEERDDDDIVNDLDDNSDEPICRICQCRQSEAPQLRMLRPCRCSGSVSWVHLDCLNQWRATSTQAYFRCSVCRYEYRIQRTRIATLLMQEEVVMALAVLMILTLIFLLGAIATTMIAHWKLSIDPVKSILLLLNVDPYWTRCILRSRYASLSAHSFALRQGMPGSPVPMMHYLCHPVVARVVETFLLGAMPVGVVGFGSYFVGVVNKLRMAQGGDWRMHLMLLVAWCASLSAQSMSRLSLAVGCAIATREIYTDLVVRARHLSHWFGDMILEPN